MPDFRSVFFVNGFLLLTLAAAMAVPLLVDLSLHQGEWPAFVAGILTSAYMGGMFVLGARGGARRELSIRETFLLMFSAWVLAGLCGSVPLALSSRQMGFTDAVFEAVSGLTTTGSTVMRGLDGEHAAILLWRAMLNWLGGLAIIAAAVAVLPRLRIGGMQLFRLESADKTEKLKTRIPEILRGAVLVYLVFTLLLAGLFLLAGMTGLEAVCHAMSALSTGGFSTSDQSLGHFGEGARAVAMLGMILGSTTFTLFLKPWKRNQWAIFGDSQLRWYLVTILFFGFLLAFWNWAGRDMDGYTALSHSMFGVVSVLSTTGFYVTDYNDWGGFSQVLFFVLAFIGGCTGSAAGGIKIFRFEVLFVVADIHLQRLLHPHGVFVVDFNRLRLSEAVVRSVLGLMMLYFLSFALLSVALTMTGVDALTGLSASASALSNVGPGLGPMIGPEESYAPLPDAAKWLLAAGMVMGRLELATVFVFFTRAFWRE